MKGWHGESYRHSLAARGIPSQLDMGEIKLFFPHYEMYIPVKGEVASLKIMIDAMDFIEEHMADDISTTEWEADQLVFYADRIKSRLNREVLLSDLARGIYDDMDEDIKKYRSTKHTIYAVSALDSAIWLLHNDYDARDAFLGREDPQSISSRVLKKALDLQRGTGDISYYEGEGQELIRMWIDEIKGRPLI